MRCLSHGRGYGSAHSTLRPSLRAVKKKGPDTFSSHPLSKLHGFSGADLAQPESVRPHWRAWFRAIFLQAWGHWNEIQNAVERCLC